MINQVMLRKESEQAAGSWCNKEKWERGKMEEKLFFRFPFFPLSYT